MNAQINIKRTPSKRSAGSTLAMLLVISVAVLTAGVLSLVTAAVPAQAAFPPGQNGSIAFVSERDSIGWDPDSRNEEIYVMSADGSHETRLTVNQGPTWSAGRDLLPSFAPDGSRVTFTSRRAFLGRPEGGVDEIYVMDAQDTDQDGNGDNLQRITGDPPHNFQSVFSPSGEHIAFVRNEDNPGSSIVDNEIYIMNANGTNQIRLTDNTVLDSLPAFSPDGQRIAFTSMREGNREIYVMEAAPEGEDNKPVNLTKNSATDTYANFSPDGKQIVFSSDRATGVPKVRNERDIWVMTSDGSGTPTQLTDSRGDDYRPDWGRDTYEFSGFFKPVDNPEAINVVNAGRAIPVKFSLSGDQGLDIFPAGYPASQQIPEVPGAEPDAIEQTVTAGNSNLSYDQLTDQYTYVWKTEKSWAGQNRELIVKLDDGTTHTAMFQFK